MESVERIGTLRQVTLRHVQKLNVKDVAAIVLAFLVAALAGRFLTVLLIVHVSYAVFRILCGPKEMNRLFGDELWAALRYPSGKTKREDYLQQTWICSNCALLLWVSGFVLWDRHKHLNILYERFGIQVILILHASWLASFFAIAGPWSHGFECGVALLRQPRLWLTLSVSFSAYISDVASSTRASIKQMPPSIVLIICALMQVLALFANFRIWRLGREDQVCQSMSDSERRIFWTPTKRNADGRRRICRNCLSCLCFSFALVGVVLLGIVRYAGLRPMTHISSNFKCVNRSDIVCTPGIQDCAPWRGEMTCSSNSLFVSGFCECKTTHHCAVDGLCLPGPPGPARSKKRVASFYRQSAVLSKKKGSRGKNAIVLSGGGAKGAWQLGVLMALCDHLGNNKTQPAWIEAYNFKRWDMLFGTSIGALNAGGLAQFPWYDQCTEGLQWMSNYWHSIVTNEFVYEAPSRHWFEHMSCLGVKAFLPDMEGLQTQGGACDPRPGELMYKVAVNATRIQTSGMLLRVLATSVRNSSAKWWSEDDEDIVDGCIASGAISPFIFPKVLRTGGHKETYIDGGIMANTPILKAVKEGADKIFVVLLQELVFPTFRVEEMDANDDKGLAILLLELGVLKQKFALETELYEACHQKGFKNNTIFGYAPVQKLHSLVDFTKQSILDSIDDGNRTVHNHDPIDLCWWVRQHNTHDKEAEITDLVATASGLNDVEDATPLSSPRRPDLRDILRQERPPPEQLFVSDIQPGIAGVDFSSARDTAHGQLSNGEVDVGHPQKVAGPLALPVANNIFLIACGFVAGLVLRRRLSPATSV